MPTDKNVFHRRSFWLLAMAALSVGMFAPFATGHGRADERVAEMTEQGVRDAFTAQLAAMVAGDTQALGAMLDEGFILTHITGHRQPKEEWLAQMRQGRFIYHSMEERSVTVELTGGRARLVGDTQTDSTVSGSRRPNGWRLRMVQDYQWRDGRWIALNCVTSLW